MTKFYYTTETEYFSNEYHTTTKIYDPLRIQADWIGCHWDNPAIIACEQVEGCYMSDEMSNTIDMLKADPLHDEDE